jgi:hypothetical protein
VPAACLDSLRTKAGAPETIPRSANCESSTHISSPIQHQTAKRPGPISSTDAGPLAALLTQRQPRGQPVPGPSQRGSWTSSAMANGARQRAWGVGFWRIFPIDVLGPAKLPLDLRWPPGTRPALSVAAWAGPVLQGPVAAARTLQCAARAGLLHWALHGLSRLHSSAGRVCSSSGGTA